MEQTGQNLEDEIQDLKKELENFQKEKERVRAIIGKIGGVPTFHTRLVNAIFVAVLIVSAVISIWGGERVRSLMIEVAVIALSIKIIYMIQCQMRVNHFKLWMLSSIEWRLNEMMKHIRSLRSK